MYPLYLVLPYDVCELIRDILLQSFVNTKIVQQTYNFDYIILKYNNYFNKYEIRTIFNVSNISTDIDYICKNIGNLYNKYLCKKYRINSRHIPDHYIKTKLILNNWCIIIKTMINSEQYIINRYTNIINITKKKIDFILDKINST